MWCCELWDTTLQSQRGHVRRTPSKANASRSNHGKSLHKHLTDPLESLIAGYVAHGVLQNQSEQTDTSSGSQGDMKCWNIVLIIPLWTVLHHKHLFDIFPLWTQREAVLSLRLFPLKQADYNKTNAGSHFFLQTVSKHSEVQPSIRATLQTGHPLLFILVLLLILWDSSIKNVLQARVTLNNFFQVRSDK